MIEVTSRHLRGAAEVLLTIPIKPELVSLTERSLAYATRLRYLLSALASIRQAGVEQQLLETAGPIERLRSIYGAQWTVHRDTQELVVAASFDRSWESYFRLLCDETGPLLDAIFSHCVGYEGNSCADGYTRFEAWVRKYHRPVDFFYAANPALSTDDSSYLQQLAQAFAPPAPASEVRVQEPDGRTPDASLSRALSALYDLRGLFPDQRAGQRTERELYDHAISCLLYHERDALPRITARSPHLAKWTGEISGLEQKRLEELAGTSDPVQLDAHALAQIQGGILTSYDDVTHGHLVMLRCECRTGWDELVKLSDKRLTTQDKASSPGPFYNLALTYDGLSRLGLPEEVLDAFPKEFREGMLARAGLLGDIGDPDYANLSTWPKSPRRQPTEPSTVDAVVVLRGRSSEDRGCDQALQELLSLKGVLVVHQQPLVVHRREDGIVVEHFGFPESGSSRTSQPVPNAILDGLDLRDGVAKTDVVALGELLLGYGNAHRETLRCQCLLGGPTDSTDPSDPCAASDREIVDLFKNGSFLVVRKLAQDVAAFRHYVDAQRRLPALLDSNVESLIVGRTRDGVPLATANGLPNDFDYTGANDAACPAFAHIRRTNPRTPHGVGADKTVVRIPRLMRRGMSYGPRFVPWGAGTADAPQDARGMMFMAYQASIADQFEVIQRWINGGNSTDVFSGQKDLLAGQGPSSPIPYWHKHGGQEVTLAPPNKMFVSLRWGLYLFVPSRAALAALRRVRGLQRREVGIPPTTSARRGDELIERLSALNTSTEDGLVSARQAWRTLLEDTANTEEAAAVWAHIRDHDGGAKRTPYGVLVASEAGAQEVLGDDGQRFSVFRYDDRLRETIGGHYLGLDPKAPAGTCPNAATTSYASLSSAPNDFLSNKLSPKDAFAGALKVGRQVLATLPADGARKAIPLRTLAAAVVAQLAHTWFGVGEDLLGYLVLTSRYSFYPYAHADVHMAKSAQAGSRLVEHYQAPKELGIVQDLRSKGYPEEHVNRSLLGAVVGFAAPAIAAIASVGDRWAQTGDLWRLADMAHRDDIKPLQRALQAALLDALAYRPIPPLLYRTASADTSLPAESGKPQEVKKGELVIVGLGAVYQDAKRRANDGQGCPEAWLFGGEHGGAEHHGPKRPPHGCPAREVALKVISGALMAVLEQPDLRHERSAVLSCGTN